MKEIPIKKHIPYLFGISIFIFIFILNKFYLRHWVIANDLPEIFQIIVFSIPNLIEAIVGTLLFTGICLQIRHVLHDRLGTIRDTYVHLFAVSLAAIYVLSQEINVHSFGGNNTYDPYDLIASVIGLSVTFATLQLYGFTESESMERKQSTEQP